MRFIDLNDSHIYTLPDLKKDWDELRLSEPENHAPDFRTDFFEILMATINGRNDLEIIGFTSHEINNIVFHLQARIQH